MASKGCLCGEKVGITGALKIRKCTIYSQVWIYRSPFRSKKEYLRACLGKASDPVADHLEATAFFRKSGGPQDARSLTRCCLFLGTSGTPVLFLHGFGASAYHWRYNLPILAQKHRVFAMDLLGMGWSDKPTGEDIYQVWPRQIAAFIKEVCALLLHHSPQQLLLDNDGMWHLTLQRPYPF